jgi:hypothetical protein
MRKAWSFHSRFTSQNIDPHGFPSGLDGRYIQNHMKIIASEHQKHASGRLKRINKTTGFNTQVS